MTILIATLGRDFGVISQDTIITDAGKVATMQAFGVSIDEAEQRTSAFTGDGNPPDDVFGDGVMSKMSVVPHMHLIAGYLAYVEHLTQWDVFLRVAPALDIDTLDVSDIRDNLHEGEHGSSGFKALHFGWSQAKKRVCGVLHYNDERKWQRLDLDPCHIVYPACDPEDSEFGELQHHAAMAADGHDVERFHVAVARNIHGAFLRGLYVKGAVFGGQLHTARIDARGISIKVAHIFDVES